MEFEATQDKAIHTPYAIQLAGDIFRIYCSLLKSIILNNFRISHFRCSSDSFALANGFEERQRKQENRMPHNP